MATLASNLEKADQIIILDIEYNLRALFLNH